jgi:Sulfatase
MSLPSRTRKRRWVAGSSATTASSAWTFAGNTPFRHWKRETYRGGISDPFIVHWPKGIKAKGEVRTQYAHAIDMVPTVLEALGIEPPTSIKGVTQSPIEGHSFAHAFDNAEAPTKHITQYFEMMGHRSIYHDGWRAVCPWPGPSFTEAGKGFGEPIPAEKLTELDAQNWDRYDVAEDAAENHNVAADNRVRLIEMIATWYVEAGKYNVLPVDGGGVTRFADPRPQIVVARTSYTYYPGTQMVSINASPVVLNRPHSMTADVEIPKGDARGVLMSAGDVQGGYSFCVMNGMLHYVYAGSRPLPTSRTATHTSLDPCLHDFVPSPEGRGRKSRGYRSCRRDKFTRWRS